MVEYVGLVEPFTNGAAGDSSCREELEGLLVLDTSLRFLRKEIIKHTARPDLNIIDK